MTAQIIPFHGDGFQPVAFDLTMDQAYAAHADFDMATDLLQFAQSAREMAKRAELKPDDRVRLMLAVAAVKDQPSGVE